MNGVFLFASKYKKKQRVKLYAATYGDYAIMLIAVADDIISIISHPAFYYY